MNFASPRRRSTSWALSSPTCKDCGKPKTAKGERCRVCTRLGLKRSGYSLLAVPTTASEPKVRCSVCRVVLMDKESEKTRHAHGCAGASYEAAS